MRNPPHPGEVIRDLYLEPMDLTTEQAAQELGVDPALFAEIVDGYADITPEMAERLSAVLGGSVAGWLQLQENYEESHRLADLRDAPIAQAAYEEWLADPSTAQPWEEVQAELRAEGLLDDEDDKDGGGL